MIRLIDNGEIEQYDAHDVYSLDESFQTFPNQAYTLHLTGVIPADKEDDWDPSFTEQLKKELTKWTDNEAQMVYEANVVFVLRNTFVVNAMRLVNLTNCTVHSIKKYLKNQNFGTYCLDSHQKVMQMAKNAGNVKCFSLQMANVLCCFLTHINLQA